MDKVMIGFPVGGNVHPAFTKSLLDLQKYELSEPSSKYVLADITYSASLYVEENRNILVDIARDKGIDWLLMVDTDEGFDPELLRKLMSTANRDTAPIVFGLYSNIMRGPEKTEGAYFHLDMIYREIASGEYESIKVPESMQPFRVDAAGTGVVLLHTSIFDKIAYPYFSVEYIVPTGKKRPQIMNEDLAFCRKAREAGFPLYCNPLAEATHYKTLALLPSTFREFLTKAWETQKKLREAG